MHLSAAQRAAVLQHYQAYQARILELQQQRAEAMQSLVAAAEYVGCWNNTWLLAAVGPANNTSLLAAIPAWWKKPSPVAQMATVPCQAWAVA